MQLPTNRFLTRLIIISLCAMGTQAHSSDSTAAEARAAGWPSLAGPMDNFQALATATPLINDLSLARLAWTSTTSDLGAGKGGGAKRNNKADLLDNFGPQRTRWAGSLTGPIIANDTVFSASFRPAGKPITFQGMHAFNKAVPFDEPIDLQLEADDLLVAIDLATGKTKWEFTARGGYCWTQGKRGGLQIAPCYADGIVYFVGTQGDLYAVNANTGTEVWRNTIGGAHDFMSLVKEYYFSGGDTNGLDKRQIRQLKRLAHLDLEKNYYREPMTPSWYGGLKVADGTLIANNSGTGLRGHDAKTGKLLWQHENIISPYASPSIWRHTSKAYILCATGGSERDINTDKKSKLSLIDPTDGTIIWQQDIAPTYVSLTPNNDKVLLNTRQPKDKSDLSRGLWGCYQLSLSGAEKIWSMPDLPKYYIPLKKDSLGKIRHTLTETHAFISTSGFRDKQAGIKENGAFVVVELSSGDIVTEFTYPRNVGKLDTHFWYLMGNKILASWDRHHSPNRGGRKPMVQATWTGTNIDLHRDAMNRIYALDLANITGGYEVTMEAAIVDGRLIERTTDGHLVCYDLRRGTNEEVYDMLADGAWRGLQADQEGTSGIPLRLRVDNDTIITGSSFPGDGKRIAQAYTTSRKNDFWRDFPTNDLSTNDDGSITGIARLDVVGEALPHNPLALTIDVQRNGDQLSGTWQRAVAAHAHLPQRSGNITGEINNTHRFAATPWLAHQPQTPMYALEDGQQAVALALPGAMPLQNSKGEHPNLSISFSHDGQRVIAASGLASRFSQGWHEVDASDLTITENTITGSLIVIIHGDNFGTTARQDGPGLLAGKITIEASFQDDGSITGNYRIEWGVPYEASGRITGTVKQLK